MKRHSEVKLTVGLRWPFRTAVGRVVGALLFWCGAPTWVVFASSLEDVPGAEPLHARERTLLAWTAERLVRRGDSPNADFVLQLRRLADGERLP